MNSQELSQPHHTAILQVMRSKKLKKSTKDPRPHLYFKVKPQKSSTELILNYKDLRDNFPYALIDYYESKMKTVSANQEDCQNVPTEEEKGKKKNISMKSLESKIIKNHSQHHSTNYQSQKPEKIILEGQQNKDDDPDVELIYDYDQYLQENQRLFKVFHTAFSEEHSVQNRYLNDLKHENGRKKPRVDYSEE